MKRKTKQKMKAVVRNYRDTLFRMLFRDKERLLSLFNAVNGTHYDDPGELMITTLEGALYLGMKNDVSCMIDMMMQLYEHQSTVNPNMPLRNLFYVSDLLQKYVYEKGLDIYSRKQIKIPTPKFVVFYNGEEEQPERKEFLLKNKAEVYHMCLYEFDVELHERVLRKEEREEGLQEGKLLAKQVFKAFLSGKTPEDIAKDLDIPLEEVEELVL